MKMCVCGIGWVTKEGYGCIRSRLHHSFRQGEGITGLSKQEIFSFPFKNFGRLDGISRMTAFAVALALKDAGRDYSPAQKQDIGILGTSSKGSLKSDIDYFKDYLAGGRTLSRGNLFIYTLPSSPLGEAAIHFGLRGPLLYVAGRDNCLKQNLDMAEEIILNQETSVMLSGQAEEEEALYFVVAAAQGNNVFCGLDEARAIVQAGPALSGCIQQFTLLRDRKG